MKHPHILQCLGMYTDPYGKEYMITEFMNKGSLLDFLQREKLDIPTQLDM